MGKTKVQYVIIHGNNDKSYVFAGAPSITNAMLDKGWKVKKIEFKEPVSLSDKISPEEIYEMLKEDEDGES